MVKKGSDALLWNTAMGLKRGTPEEMEQFRITTKLVAREASLYVCLEALQLFGGMGIDRELPMEKYLRDAVTTLHQAGTADVARLKLVNSLMGGNLYGQPVQEGDYE